MQSLSDAQQTSDEVASPWNSHLREHLRFADEKVKPTIKSTVLKTNIRNTILNCKPLCLKWHVHLVITYH